MIYRFDTLGSTNDEAQNDKYGNGDIVVACHQTSGRGQRGHKWLSSEGLNLTLSAIFLPQGVESRNQFIVSQAVALAACDLLTAQSLSPKIKWTNDIYIGDRKIAGILIENRIQGAMLARTVVGIGLNVNECEFDPELPNPTSIALERGATLPLDEVLDELAAALVKRFDNLAASAADIASEYNSLLYRQGEPHPFRLPCGEVRVGSIRGVAPTSHLEIEWCDCQSGSYLFGEVEFVIERQKVRK